MSKRCSLQSGTLPDIIATNGQGEEKFHRLNQKETEEIERNRNIKRFKTMSQGNHSCVASVDVVPQDSLRRQV